MKTNTPTSFDLDHFYSSESIDEWKQIIGEDLHYHFGYFQSDENLETGLKQTVRNFYPYINPGSTVLDIGCGWGGPAKMLEKDQQCNVTATTISTRQAQYCREIGLTTHVLDLERDNIEGQYNLIFSLEVLSHIRNKAKLLKRLRPLAPRLILSVNCVADNYIGKRDTFGDSMILCSVTELTESIQQAGWHVQFMQNRRFQSLRTFVLWKQNLEKTYGKHQPPGQLEYLKRHVDTALQSPVKWCQSFPLIDIVAD